MFLFNSFNSDHLHIIPVALKCAFKPVEGFSVLKPFTRCVIYSFEGRLWEKGSKCGRGTESEREKEKRKEADFKHVSSEKARPFTSVTHNMKFSSTNVSAAKKIMHVSATETESWNVAVNNVQWRHHCRCFQQIFNLVNCINCIWKCIQYIYVYICMYVCVFVCICVCIFMCVCVCLSDLIPLCCCSSLLRC